MTHPLLRKLQTTQNPVDCGRGLWYSINVVFLVLDLILGLPLQCEVRHDVQNAHLSPRHQNVLFGTLYLPVYLRLTCVGNFGLAELPLRFLAKVFGYITSFQCAIQRATNSRSNSIISNGGVKISLNRAIFMDFMAQPRTQTKKLDTVYSRRFIKKLQNLTECGLINPLFKPFVV